MNSQRYKSYHHIYFLGIGGVSMSGLAEILLSKGYQVSGSDMKESATVKHLKNLGVHISIGHRPENITDDIELLVYTAAVKTDNPELVAAAEKRIPIMDRAELLGQIMEEYNRSVAVSGTHGKTTTTSMLSEILLSADVDPTISIGGTLPTINGTIRVGESGYFVAEACEYFNSFLKFKPYVGIILNVEAEHLDFFKDLKQIQDSFRAFGSGISSEGCLVLNCDMTNREYISEAAKASIITFSATNQEADWHAENIHHEDNGFNSFDAIYQGKLMGRISLQIPGEHNISNALAACAAATYLGIVFQQCVEGLSRFHGANRRFQRKGSFQGVTVIDDYAHHPTEVKATLAAAAKVKHNKIWCVFQPHTYTRLKAFLPVFGAAFSDADNIIVTDIYAAREKDTGLVHAKDLVKEICKNGRNAIYIKDFTDVEDYARKNCQEGDLLITMGAGDVVTVGEALVK